MATLCAGAQESDTVQLPYTAIFTQGWTAEGGATITDGNHATLATVGDRLVSPWFEADSGLFFVQFKTDYDDDFWYNADTAVYNIIKESENGGTDTMTFWWLYPMDGFAMYTSGEYFRIVIEYIGNDTLPDLPLRELVLFQYPMEFSLEGVPDTAYVGDTITVTLNVSLPEGEIIDTNTYLNIYLHRLIEWAPGQYVWQGDMIRLTTIFQYDHYTIDSICDIIAHTDRSITLVWKRPDNYRFSGSVHKSNVYNDYGAWDNTSLYSIYVLSHNAIQTARHNDINVYSQTGGIVVCGAQGERITVYDMMGRTVATSVAGGQIIGVPQTGVYMVRVGDRPARKVVVME